ELEIDPESPADLQTLKALVTRADVVVHGLGPQAISRLGLDVDDIRAKTNPGLVSAALLPFPDGHPAASLPAYDTVAAGAGLIYDKPIGPPRLHDFAIGPVMSGLFGAAGIVAALIARQATGRGQHVDTTQYHSNLFAQVLQVLIKTGIPRGFLPFKMIGTPFVKRWRCGDGRYIFLHITLPAHCKRILDLLEEDGYAKEVAQLRSIISEETFADPSQVKSITEAKAIREAYDAIFATRSAQEWEDSLGKELCCIKVRTIDEWVEDSMASGMSDVVEVDDPVFGPLKVPGPVVTPVKGSPPPPSRLVETDDGRHLLERWKKEPSPHAQESRSPASIGALRAPLEGIKVLDLSRIIAGPCCARVLGELGADVISVQNPTNLDWALSFHLVFSAGKRSVTLDFKDEEGKKKLWKLIDELKPDALVQNYRNLDVARAVGVDPDTVLGRYPEMAYTYLNAYGNKGEWQQRPGFEQVVQAVSGVQMTYAKDGVPVLFPSPIVDIGCGLAGAFGTLVNLYGSRRGGGGGVATTHLTNQSILFQVRALAELQREEGLTRARQAGSGLRYDHDARIISEIVRVRDGWALLAGPRRDIERWLEHAGLKDRWWLPGEGLFNLASKVMVTRPAAEWRKSLERAGLADTVALLELPRMKTLVDDIAEIEAGPRYSVLKKDFPGVGEPLTFVRCPIRLSDTPTIDPGPAPIRGADTHDVLSSVGLEPPAGAGTIPYPENKPIWVWAASFVRWGYFAWRAGQI
ncbi:MAG: CoA transferase, partial [Myxococcota bacterium]